MMMESVISMAREPNGEAPLEEMRSLAELREAYQTDRLMEVFLSGELEAWLEARYYEREAAAVRRLERVRTPAAERKLCEALGCSGARCLTPRQQEVYERKCAAIRQHTQDPAALEHAMETATDQLELAELLNAGAKTIWLCGGPFAVPIRKGGVHYIGIGDPGMEAPFTGEQYRRAGITFQGIRLPDAADAEAAAFAGEAARDYGYDDFGETHTPPATALHFAVKGCRFSRSHHLDTDVCGVGGGFYKSKWAAEKAAHRVIEEAYKEANGFFEPGSKTCIAPESAAEYASMLRKGAEGILERLRPICAGHLRRQILLQALEESVRQAEQKLRETFERELAEDADYYRMYEKKYFFEQLEIEKNDYNLDLFDSDLMNGIARLIHDDSEYTVENLHELVTELEEDVNKHADTFYGVAWREYQNYCSEMEKIAEEIGQDLSGGEVENRELRQCGQV